MIEGRGLRAAPISDRLPSTVSMNILILCNHSVLNAGDHAIETETLLLLERTFPGARITMTFNDVVTAREVWPQVAILPSPLAWAFPLTNNTRYRSVGKPLQVLYLVLLVVAALSFRWFGRMPRVFANHEKQALLDEIAQADLVLIVGGGHLYAPASYPNLLAQVWYGFWLTFTLVGAVVALLCRKPLVLLPQSIGPFSDAYQYGLIRWIVRHAKLTFVRELRSYQVLDRLHVTERTLCVPDFAFGHASAPGSRVAPLLDRFHKAHPQASYRVGVTAMDWSTQSGGFARQQVYEASLLACIDAITEEDGVVYLFGQCAGPTPHEDDRIIAERLRAQARQPERIVVVREVLAPGDYQAIYGTLDYFIGTRMHSVILALNAGTPALTIGYLHKTAGVFQLLGLAERVYDINTMTPNSLLAAFAQLRATPEQPGVAPFLERARRTKQAIGAMLRGIVGSL